ncbi:recombination regulator RecX [Ampullimonas aquatilis]|uniref:recombination regulator RecX n=1 Tax=Ampullimonas aquatilis TaxID=1341549 RepID=UPI003C73CAEA
MVVPSLKARALRYLSQREHSRLELRRKLARHTEEPDTLDALLDELETRGWLNSQRFAESFIHRRANKLGTSRILAELKQHAIGPDLLGQAQQALQGSEMARAQAVWQKRFGESASSAQERAKQIRFLQNRGFSHDIISQVLKYRIAHEES